MNLRIYRPMVIAGVAGAVAVVLNLAAAPVDARDRGSRVRSHDTQVQRSPGTRQRQDVWTRRNGATATREATVVRDREAGVRTRDVEHTGPKGRTTTRHDETRRTDSGYTRESTVTGPNGATATRNVSVERDPAAGTRSKTVETTGPEGRTRTLEDEIRRQDNGHVRTTELTRADGSSTTREVEVTRDPETKTVTRNVEVTKTPPPAPPQP